MSRPPVADQVQVNFRMPVALRDRIKVAAEANNRSMNAEIVATLEEKYPPSDPLQAAINRIGWLTEQIRLATSEGRFDDATEFSQRGLMLSRAVLDVARQAEPNHPEISPDVRRMEKAISVHESDLDVILKLRKTE